MDFDKRQSGGEACAQKRDESHEPIEEAVETTGPAQEPLSLPAVSSAVPPEAIALVRRVARYLATYYEGLHLYDGDHDLAVEFAQQSPDRMTEEQLGRATATIEENPRWEKLLCELEHAAEREIDTKRRRPPTLE